MWEPFFGSKNTLKPGIIQIELIIIRLLIIIGSLSHELDLMVFFGVCFEIPIQPGTTLSAYMFPSLSYPGILFFITSRFISILIAIVVDFKFSIEQKRSFSYEGVRVKLGSNGVFVPGFLCQLIVTLCKKLNISLIISVYFNSLPFDCY